MTSANTGVYAVENLYSQRVYVGSTKDSFRHRWESHLAGFRHGKHWNPGIREDAERYGACSFRFIILQRLPREVEHVTFERFWHRYLSSLGLSCVNVRHEKEEIISKNYVPEVPPAYRYRAWDIAQRCLPRLGTDTILYYRKLGIIHGIRCQSGWYFESSAIEQIHEHLERQRNANRKIPYGLDASVA